MNASVDSNAAFQVLCQAYPIVTLVVSVAGLALNVFFAVVLVKFVRRHDATDRSSKYAITGAASRGDMYKYILAKTLGDAVQFCAQIPRAFYQNPLLPVYQSYLLQLWYVGFYYYVEGICQMFSGLMSVAAAFDVYSSIVNRFGCLRRRSRGPCAASYACLLIGALLAFCSLFYVYYFFRFDILPLNDGGYTIGPSNFTRTVLFQALEITHGGVRDALAVVVLTVLNLLILYHFKKSMASKRKLQLTSLAAGTMKSARTTTTALPSVSTTTSGSTNSPDAASRTTSVLASKKASIERADRSVTRSFLVNGLIYILGHAIGFLNYCQVIPDNLPFECALGNLGEFLFHVSCMVPVVLFIRTNKPIRRLARSTLCFCKCSSFFSSSSSSSQSS